ncbi:MAG TPA: phosphoribosylformylglycinamidine cyclo-ligase [Armatimonadota bacterium]|jgi:phosphoribosylformylglycinamidine cyclo-ligase
MSITYKDSGVNIAAADAAKKRMKALVDQTRTPGVIGGIGAFGGLFKAAFHEMSEPVLVASADGVGTKLKIAFAAGRHNTVGMDLVHHCANDILVQGARSLFFLDYIALGHLVEDTVVSIVEGLSKGCQDAGCALLGGETAEMPDFYARSEYDLAGFIVGVVDKGRILDGSAVKPGDVLLGLASDGLHTNGYSLARKALFSAAGYQIDTVLDGVGETLADALLRPHRCYAGSILPLVGEGMIHGMAHITGGGLVDNIPRSLPEGVGVSIDRHAWEVPSIFEAIRSAGDVPDAEMYRAFNMGVGMVLMVAPDAAGHVASQLAAAGETVFTIGDAKEGPRHVQIEGV